MPFKNSTLYLGRRINLNIANIGAVDGLQAEQGIGKFRVGVIAGSRPDHEDYSFNAQLMQFGGFINHTTRAGHGNMSSTIAVMEQRNGAFTDRRFIYLQHSNRLLENLYLLSSVQMNLYEVADSIPTGTFKLSSFYMMLRYRYSEKLSASVSYDLRENIIYYETYKNYLDALIEEHMRQGLNAHLTYRAFNFATLGLRASYRFRKEDLQPSKNISGYMWLNRLPVRGLTANFNYNYLSSSYLQGSMYGIRLQKDLISGKLSSTIQYRYFSGRYITSEIFSYQHIVEAQISWNIYKRLNLSASYEATFERGTGTNRLYLSLTQRF